MPERLLVRDLMSVGVQTCTPDTSIGELTRLLLDKDLEGVIVLDQEGRAVGVVSRDDLVRAYTRDDCRRLTAGEVMTEDVIQVPPDIPLTAAAQIMRDKGVRVIFLMHNAAGISYPAAVISYTHFLRHLAAQHDDELNDLGIEAARQAPLEAFRQKRDAARRQTTIPHQE
jgi:CBS-domain-containing membrane protein